MKNLTTNLMLAAIALAAASGVASAQQLKAEIPFSFRAQGTLVPAGPYTVTKYIELSRFAAVVSTEA